MEWTEKKPTQPGWYWWRAKHGYKAKLTQVMVNLDEEVFIAGTDALIIFNFVGEWAGPLEPPT